MPDNVGNISELICSQFFGVGLRWWQARAIVEAGHVSIDRRPIDHPDTIVPRGAIVWVGANLWTESAEWPAGRDVLSECSS